MMFPGHKHAGFHWTHAAAIALVSAILAMAIAYLSQTPVVLK